MIMCLGGFYEKNNFDYNDDMFIKCDDRRNFG